MMVSKIHLPDFLVIGAEKGGTTWLYTQLKKHPDIFLPATKEVQFFNKYNSNLIQRDYFQQGIDWYANFFKQYNGQKAVGEVTPMYLCDAEAPLRIKQTLPHVKLIAILRNPVQRAWSHYCMAKNKEHTKLTFREAIRQREPRFIDRGLYYNQLKIYYQLFQPNKIIVIFYEEVFKNPEHWLSEICKFLSVDDSFYVKDSSIHEKVFPASAYKSAKWVNIQNAITHKIRKNKTLGKVLNWLKRRGVTECLKKLNAVEKPYDKINEGDAILLKEFYKEDIAALSLLLKKELPF